MRRILETEHGLFNVIDPKTLKSLMLATLKRNDPAFVTEQMYGGYCVHCYQFLSTEDNSSKLVAEGVLKLLRTC
jgi:hypothetical protein